MKTLKEMKEKFRFTLSNISENALPGYLNDLNESGEVDYNPEDIVKGERWDTVKGQFKVELNDVEIICYCDIILEDFIEEDEDYAMMSHSVIGWDYVDVKYLVEVSIVEDGTWEETTDSWTYDNYEAAKQMFDSIDPERNTVTLTECPNGVDYEIIELKEDYTFFKVEECDTQVFGQDVWIDRTLDRDEFKTYEDAKAFFDRRKEDTEPGHILVLIKVVEKDEELIEDYYVEAVQDEQ